MRTLVIVNNTSQWPLKISGVEVVSSRRYLTDASYATSPHTRVYNLCRSYGYQSLGYYVSLLAEARGHHPLPSVGTLQDFKSPSLIRFYSEELEERIQRSLAPLQGSTFTLSIYFGRNMAKRYERLSLEIFNLFPAPLLRAEFTKTEDGWELRKVRPIPASEIPEAHHDFVIEAATRYFSRGRRPRKEAPASYHLAILHDPEEAMPTSDEAALRKFIRAAEDLGIEAEKITSDDFGTLAEFDALFIRETTSVKNHTFRFSRRAVAEGLVVIDDPESILKCGNKVYLAELLARNKIPAPRTLIIHRENAFEIAEQLGLPCVLKQPDSAFSQGVVKVADKEALNSKLKELLEDSDLIIAQEYLPTEFDWRIGVLDRKALYACKYYMARDHWQIIRHGGKGRPRFGRWETFAVEDAPPAIVETAVEAANLIGDGLYGVDVKEIKGKPYVVEINDNPTIEAACEDGVLKDRLYEEIMRSFLRRIERAKQAGLPK